ncbi:MAG: HAMP domain-containing protein [Thermogemmatispora sp.]|jgi:methyl-accepting chemotaxis protein|uniref:methyl-accepting chemotaxis protein n=1 Tax=Thermogemmatispora sp. TaxID=1968838 RepID=UPI0019EEBF04|nr:methyl-accepting chemotaxis protein [Thermogemmatispora sp.]MBE3564789.1 HAMP domain-containing protein [Thermogemmatispora sp.]
MNPDRNRGGMTVSGLMNLGLAVSAIIPAFLLILVGIYARLSMPTADTSVLIVVVIICAIVALLAVVITNYLVNSRIKDRFLALADVCHDFAGGDRRVRAQVDGDDEFARLVASVNTVLDQQSAQANSASGLGSGSDAAALQAQIEKLLQEVSAVGDGDLRVQAEVTPDTLGVLADSFNYMIEELAKVVGRVQSTAMQVTNATRRILDRAAELAQASEMQVQQISQTTEAVEALAIFIQNVARNAQLSHEAAQEALRNAQSGQEAVRQTIEGMMLIRENVQETAKKIKRLGERSNEIGEIVRIIEDIADQTNLLALNAAIQSAMAGEHGRGFAVVADEIRLLAERSTESTKRIATLVKSIQGDTYEAVVAMEDSTQEVVKGSQLADEAGRALNSIYSAVERQAQMIESIARAANEQTSVSEAVAVAMSQISEITRQTNAGTQEAAASVSYLAELADQLRASVSTFRLPDHVLESINSSMATGPGAVPGLPAGGDQFYASAGGDGWMQPQQQSYGGNFPPLPEPESAGLVAMSSPVAQNQHQAQFGFPAASQEFGAAPGFSDMGSFGSTGQQDFGAAFGSSPAPSFNQEFGASAFSNSQPFEAQRAFGSFDPFANQGFSGPQGQSAFSQQPFANPPASGAGFGSSGQGAVPYSGGGQFASVPPQAFGAPPQSGQGQGPQPRQPWTPPGAAPQQSPHQQPGQSPFPKPEQTPFPRGNNGQFGQ